MKDDDLVRSALRVLGLLEALNTYETSPFGSDEFSGRSTKRTGALVARSATCRDFLMHPLILGAVKKVLARATSFQLHLTQVISIGPGEPAQAIHRDQWAFDMFPFP